MILRGSRRDPDKCLSMAAVILMELPIIPMMMSRFMRVKDLSLFASGSINTNSGARFAGETLLTTGTNNGNITFNGATNTFDANSNLRVIANGDLTYNGASATRGELISAKNFFFNGNSNLYGSISAKGNITFNGSASVIGVAPFPPLP
ncbi:MAG: hypothetical protein HC930_05315 [Hydrococcus sp. SU_1_0]|nr:hypothetical protein [Hydrococcus sp. SU_1_0]NJO97602.1 hypothetical protein [Pleurocapsa sp. CRU_1_2]